MERHLQDQLRRDLHRLYRLESQGHRLLHLVERLRSLLQAGGLECSGRPRRHRGGGRVYRLVLREGLDVRGGQHCDRLRDADLLTGVL